jgi:hypothetical protein
MLFQGIYTPAVVGSIPYAPTNVFAGQGIKRVRRRWSSVI